MLQGFLLCLSVVLPSAANDVGESVRFRGRGALHMEMIVPAGQGKVLFDTGESDQTQEPYDTVLVNGLMPDPRVRLELSVASLGGMWHSWAPAETRRMPDGRFWARYKFDGIRRDALRLRAVDAGVKAAHLFEIYDLETFVAGTGSDAEPSVRRAGPAVRPSTGTYRFVTRQEWGAKLATAEYAEHSPVRFTMHHTAGRRPATYEEAAQEMAFLQDYHQKGRGWIDIGYHFVVSPTGHVFQGRPEGVKGAHVLNQNTGNLGVSFMGDFHPPRSDQPSPESLDAFVALGRRLRADHPIPIEDVKAHRDRTATDCPGDVLYAKLPALKAAIAGQPPKPVVGLPRDFSGDPYLKSLPW